MTSITVNSTTALLNALKTAHSGDTISLASGAYSGVNIADLQNVGVTITSADPGNPAVLTDLTVKNSSGITFSNLEIAVSKDCAVQVLSSSNINMDGLYVHGSLDGTSHDDTRGMLVRWSSNVTITNSHFEELTDALSQVDNQHITISGNSFDTIRDNGIVGGGSQFVTISDNYFTNFDHIGDIHPDAIQVWTAGTTQAGTDIVIDGNVFDRGTGAAIQGVQIRDEAGGLTYQRVAITNNTIIGADNAINVRDINGLTVSGNTVLGYTDTPSKIAITNATGVSMTDNVSTGYDLGNAQISQSGNVQMAAVDPATAARERTVLLASASQATMQKVAALPVDTTGDLHTLAADLAAKIIGSAHLLGFIDGPSTAADTPAYHFTDTLLQGTAGADTLRVGAVGGYHLDGGAGNDVLVGGGTGINHLAGGIGNDSYTVYQAGDIVVEDANGGTDTVTSMIDYSLTDNVENLYAGTAGLTLHGNALDNTVYATSGTNWLYGEGGNDSLQGGSGTDHLYGGIGDDRLMGKDGDDVLYGDDGNDSLNGGAGNDQLYGGAGNDTFEGGAGMDSMWGGAGADTFIFRTADVAAGLKASADVINDFSSVEKDKISLSMIDANSNTAADDAFKFIGTSAFHHIAGELRYETTSTGVHVYGDTNGDGVADFDIFAVGVTSLAASDFQL